MKVLPYVARCVHVLLIFLPILRVPMGLRMTHVYAAHVHITQGRVVRLCVIRAVHLVLHPAFVRISGKPGYAGYV